MTQEAIKLEAKIREEENGKAKDLRVKGFVPANVYGSDFPAKSVKIKETDFKRAFNLAGESHLIDLIIDNNPAEKVIIKEVQKDFIKDKVIHVDFYRVDMAKKIVTEIPLNFIGESSAVKELGGTLIKNTDTIEVKCLPGNLVDKIDVDLSCLVKFHDAIKMNDLKLPSGMELTATSDEIVVTVLEPVKEEIVEAAPAATEEKAVEGVEVEAKGKEKGEKEGEKKEEKKK
jgi:large subunit ribosomal protein L25